ncbi:chaplin [Allostreptomyces psammosilenae]|uniref:Chaplin domain-containing protein n=1 Tax=Allostreptomyces psammosilenae TaxID=1892865 RepID=A0A852ZVC3_9ACTN|nr:chaplin [Allostreptomyces psammosilenae]NYI06343.1 hypothetical protein [Allostreptomyces psammosilenae]
MSFTRKAAVLTATAGALVVSTAGVAAAEAESETAAVGSPGIISGNAIDIPIHIPLNVCGNTVDIIGVLNPSLGNYCENAEVEVEEDENGPGNGLNG